MKKITFTLLMLVLLLTLVGCGHKHEYTDEVVAPTCTEKGYTKHTCECGDTYNDSEVDAKGHSYGEWVVVKEATEEAAGSKERVCSVCGNKETETIAKLDHTHKYTDTVVEPTCTEGGYTEHKCECGHSYIDNETQPSHKEQVLKAKEATCTEDGLTEGKKCSVCNEVLVEQTVIPHEGHEYGDWKTVKEPTVSEEGIKERQCTKCNNKEQGTIDMIEEAGVYRIKFVENKENVLYPSRPAKDRDEIINALFADMYEWAKLNGEKSTYEKYVESIKTKLAAYSDIKIRNTDLGNYPAEDGSTEYFLNVPKYFTKWSDFFAVFHEAMLKVNSTQSFYTDTYAAMVRLNQFITWSSTGQKYFNTFLTKMYNATKITVEVPKTYKLGEEVVLPELSLENGLKFLGWYDNPEFTGIKIEKILKTDTGHKTFYAKWEDEVLVDNLEINDISELLLFTTHQLEWTITPDNATDKSVEFFSSNEAVATVNAKGLITALSNGTVTITVKVYGNRALDLTFEVNVYTNDYIDGSYESTSYVEVNKEVKLLAEIIRKDKSTAKVNWSSLNTDIATVSNEGVVKAVKQGVATIVASDPENADLKLEFAIVVFDKMPIGILDLAVRSNNSNIFTRYDLNIGGAYSTDILGSVSKIFANSKLEKNTSYYDKANKSTATYGTMESIEFITVHYTGNMVKGSTAKANANYFAGSSDVSIHYTTGNDGVYYCLDESKGAWHAGDSGALAEVGKFQWLATGVKVKDGDPQYPKFTISTDFYFEINGNKTSVKMPKPWNYSSRNTDHTMNSDGTLSSKAGFSQSGFSHRDADEFINDQSLPFMIKNGEYYMGTTWWCYTQVYEGRICGTGGNRNSIGIESCVNEGSDLWWTWQKTAQLVADIMVRQKLDITRVRGHHFFSAKNCPQPMLENDQEIWYEFLELVEAEYELLTKYNGYEVTIKSNNPDIIDNYGRVVKQPAETTCVTYTITFTKGSDVQSITLASMVKGVYVDR